MKGCPFSAKLWRVALSSDRFLSETNDYTLARYKKDLRKFQFLRAFGETALCRGC